MEGFTIPTPRTVEEVSSDFSIDMVKLYQTCHPEKDNLCLFGLPNETWKVNNLPDEETGMQKKDWVSLVAVHSDSWLLSVAFYFGARCADDDEQGGPCGACGDNFGTDEFWICCDQCEQWFHGRCVKITPEKAEHIVHYKCPRFSYKRARPC
ncbi:hypothetical protein BRARA_B03111 [Brassica rapa]|uniref:PHD finger protein ALFIN-LIKE n=1 Tax=Brassica campestris TaxID=3711 RepID=A0A398AE95_BRACM|nr:hypothetical protein BRARA_B03111 [Brassica rapa]